MAIRNRITSYPAPLIPVNPGPIGPPGPPGLPGADGSGTNVIISSTAPENPVNGQAWLQDTTGIFSIWNEAQQVWVVPATNPLPEGSGDEIPPDAFLTPDGALYLTPDGTQYYAQP
jgi:hypothetical protein